MNVVVIGGGWSGLAAAITLCQAGKKVSLFEAAKQLGGRARNVEWNGTTVDNGQHLMIGAYKQMLEMMQVINCDIELAFERKKIDLQIIDDEYPPLRLSANHWLPWPLSLAANLIKSAGFNSFLAIARLQKSIPLLLSEEDVSVIDWLTATKQPERLIKQLWEPLCLATLNTPIKEASSHLLATVIKDSLGQDQQSADLLIPKQPLGDIFPEHAANYIKQHGGEIHLQARVNDITIKNGRVHGVTVNDQLIEADQLIIATAQSAAENLLQNIAPIAKFKHFPIITLYLQFHAEFRLPDAMLGMSGTVSQWLFDRSEQQPGLIAVVISGPGHHESMNNQQLVDKVLDELINAQLISNKSIVDHLVIRDKRATFAATKACSTQRPNANTAVSGLWLAGDYILNNYPATIEGAIINGRSCAEKLITLTN